VGAARKVDGVDAITPYYDAGTLGAAMISHDRATALVLLGLGAQTLSQAEDVIPRLRAALRSVNAPPGLELLVTGPPAIYYDAIVAGKRDTTRAELVALPLTGIAPVLAFASLTAAAIPLLVGLLSVTLTLAFLFVLGSAFHVYLNAFAQTVATMVGLAVGIDYALLVVARFRETLERQPDATESAIATGTTAGRTVAVSGAAVALSLGALGVAGSPVLRSMGYAGVSAVLVALLAALTAVPALLSLLGRRIDAPHRLHDYLTRVGSRAGPAWRTWVTTVLEHPLRYTVLALLALAALAWPARALTPDVPGAEALPPTTESRRGAQALITMGNPGLLNPLQLLIDTGGPGHATSLDFLTASLNFTRRLEALRGVDRIIGPTSGPPLLTPAAYRALYAPARTSDSGPLAPLADATISKNGDRALYTIIPTAQLTSGTTLELQQRIDHALQSYPALHPETARFGGWALASADIFHTTWAYFPPMVLAVLLLTFALLTLAFRSLLVPLKAVTLNALSVLASYGVLVAVFQYGWGARLLGVTPALDPSRLYFLIPILLFGVIFGLSMDYEVFLVARIREHRLAGATDHDSIVAAIERTGPLITWAAILMATVFLAFLTARTPYIVETGLPLAVAILLDATLVRIVLVPAFMQLAGRWNWWLPRGLARVLPKVDLEPRSAASDRQGRDRDV